MFPPEEPEVPRASRVRYRVLAAACALAIVTYVHRVGFATAASSFKGPLGLTDWQMGMLMAAFMLAYGGFEIPWGWVGDRLGVRHLLAVVALGGSLLTAGVVLVAWLPAATVWPFAFLVVVRFLFGAFQAGTFPALSRMMADWMPTTERGSAQGLIWMSSRMGGALAPFVLVNLFASLGGWRLPLLLAASLGGLWCLAFWPWFRNRPEDLDEVSKAELARINAGRSTRPAASHGDVPWSRLVRSGNVWSLCLMYGCLGYSGNFFLTLLPTYLQGHRKLGESTTGLLTSLPFACGVVACVTGGFLSDAIIRWSGSRTWGRRAVGMAGMAVASGSILSTVWVTDVGMLAALLGLTFFGNDLAMGPAWASAAEIGERHAGTVGGAMNMFANLTSVIASLATGRLLHAGYDVAPFAIFACVYAVGALCWLGVDPRRSLSEKPAPLPFP